MEPNPVKITRQSQEPAIKIESLPQKHDQQKKTTRPRWENQENKRNHISYRLPSSSETWFPIQNPRKAIGKWRQKTRADGRKQEDPDEKTREKPGIVHLIGFPVRLRHDSQSKTLKISIGKMAALQLVFLSKEKKHHSAVSEALHLLHIPHSKPSRFRKRPTFSKD